MKCSFALVIIECGAPSVHLFNDEALAKKMAVDRIVEEGRLTRKQAVAQIDEHSDYDDDQGKLAVHLVTPVYEETGAQS